MTIAEQLAQLISTPDGIPSEAISKSKDAVQDAIAAAISGIGAPASIAAHKAALETWGNGSAPVWFSNKRLSVPGAAFVNSTLTAVMDLDDGHRAAAGHPGAGIIPAVMATIAAYGGGQDKAMIAIILGYEVAIRIAAARDYSKLTTMVSGPWVGQGVAAAAAYLRGLTPVQTAQAIALAGASAPNLSVIAYSKFMGTHLKEGIPWATATGLTAVNLAVSGFTGPIDLLDNPKIYSREVLLDGLGEKWAISDIYFKPYSCCRWAHAAIDAALDLQRQHELPPEDITRIDIETFAWALRLNNEKRPTSLEAAQYSVPFCVALALTHGAEAFLPLQQSALDDTVTLALAQWVDLKVTEPYDNMFPARVPAKVKITSQKGEFVREVLVPLGEPSNPMSPTQMNKKLSTVTGNMLHTDDKHRLTAAIEDFRTGKLDVLQRALSQPVAP